MNTTKLYREAITPKSPDEEIKLRETKIQEVKNEENNKYSWNQWRTDLKTQEYIKVLENAWVNKCMQLGAVCLTIPQQTDLIKSMGAEVGTLQKVLKSMIEGKYE